MIYVAVPFIVYAERPLEQNVCISQAVEGNVCLEFAPVTIRCRECLKGDNTKGVIAVDV
jgi:hypothetical protein